MDRVVLCLVQFKTDSGKKGDVCDGDRVFGKRFQCF